MAALGPPLVVVPPPCLAWSFAKTPITLPPKQLQQLCPRAYGEARIVTPDRGRYPRPMRSIYSALWSAASP